jgi:ATP-binding cassette subfamily A (ABC1) protein 1
MYSVFSIIATLVEEKETRARELLRMMSVRTESLVASWYITYGCVFLGLNLVLTLSSSVGWGVGVFARASSSLLFVFMFLFSMSSIGYAYMIHTFCAGPLMRPHRSPQ